MRAAEIAHTLAVVILLFLSAGESQLHSHTVRQNKPVFYYYYYYLHHRRNIDPQVFKSSGFYM